MANELTSSETNRQQHTKWASRIGVAATVAVLIVLALLVQKERNQSDELQRLYQSAQQSFERAKASDATAPVGMVEEIEKRSRATEAALMAVARVQITTKSEDVAKDAAHYVFATPAGTCKVELAYTNAGNNNTLIPPRWVVTAMNCSGTAAATTSPNR